MFLLVKMVVFHCYVSLPECRIKGDGISWFYSQGIHPIYTISRWNNPLILHPWRLSKGNVGYPWESTRDIHQHIPPIYGLYNGCIGQYGVILGEQLLGYTPKGTQLFPLRLTARTEFHGGLVRRSCSEIFSMGDGCRWTVPLIFQGGNHSHRIHVWYICLHEWLIFTGFHVYR